MKMDKEAIFQEDGSLFPSKTYSDLVLKPAYDEAKCHFIVHMMNINYAHAIMLAEEGIIKNEDAKKIAAALRELEGKEYQSTLYNPKFEDLFFRVESELLEKAGSIGGNLHIGRSRNDMGIAIYRMTLKEKLITLIEKAVSFYQSIITLMETHKKTIMLGYTHTQQAQPTTLAHYLSGMADILSRDIHRLFAALSTVDSSSMGAAALTTSGFPINRYRMQTLLGFGRMIENSWDAVAGADYLTETAAAVQLSAVHLGRSIQDFLLWGTQEYGAVKLATPYVQISSIMPQKRNPVSMEHMRAILSGVSGDMQTALLMVHNTPFGDIVDTEDDLQPYLWRGIDKLAGVFQLCSYVLLTMEVDKEKLRKRAEDSFANVTELADTLVRVDGLSFRQAHEAVSNAVKAVVGKGKERLSDLTLSVLNEQLQALAGKKSLLSEKQFKLVLDPHYFIQVRKLKGGPNFTVMESTIESKKREHVELVKKCTLIKKNWMDSQTTIKRIIDEWMN
ncbi:argininosuccinate lyase [Bacillus sp. 1P06AnD]|uniref:argininosuccinate lyase n=1 Tax=Bacillus sp. 1P06AnD TaxID=3132208 RepID=UPI0039A112B1